MTSQNEFVDKVVLSLIGKLSTEDVKLVKDALISVSGDYEITRTCTEIIVSEYELPDCYKMYIATKTMNGEFSSQGTIKLYKDVIEKMLYTFAVPVDMITTNMLRGYFAKMQTTPSVLTGKIPSNNTINNRKRIVRSFFQWLAEEEYINKDVSARIKGERVELKPEPVFTDMELEKMRAACKKKPPNGWQFSKYRDLAIIDVLSSTGVRVKELYEDCYAKLISDNAAVADAMLVAKLIKEVDKEHSEAYSFWLYKKSTDFDINVIIGEQKYFC